VRLAPKTHTFGHIDHQQHGINDLHATNDSAYEAGMSRTIHKCELKLIIWLLLELGR